MNTDAGNYPSHSHRRLYFASSMPADFFKDLRAILVVRLHNESPSKQPSIFSSSYKNAKQNGYH